MWPHVGTLNSARSTFSSFNWLNIYLSNSFNSSIHVFQSKIALDWPWANLGALIAQPQKNTESKEYTYACFGGQAFQGKPQSHLQRRKQGWGREKALNLSFSAPLTNCNVATCWHVELSTLNLLLLWLNIYLSNSFNWAGVGESWGVACATTEKHWCLRSIHMPVLAGRLSRANRQSHLQRRKQGWGREKALNLSVSAPLTNCNVATCWHVELSTLNLLLL